MNGHGGKREGAGRKKGVDMVRMRVPKALQARIQAMVQDYKDEYSGDKPSKPFTLVPPSGDDMKPNNQDKLPAQVADDIKSNNQDKLPSQVADDIKSSNQDKPTPTAKLATRKQILRLPSDVKRKLIKQYGTLTNAAKVGIYVDGKTAYAR